MDTDTNLQSRNTNDHQHSPYSIAQQLETLKLQMWSHVLLMWLGRFDGLEQYMDVEDAPPVQVRELFAKYVKAGQVIFPKTIATDLANLPFLLYRARRADGTEWNSHLTSFLDFASGQEIEVWQGENPYPESQLTQAYLLTAYMQQQTSERRA